MVLSGCDRAPTQGDTFRSISTSRRAIAAAGLTAVLLAGGTTASHAAPAPDRGIDSGGTRVTLPAPDVRFTQVDGGSSHSLWLGDDGDVYAWGSASSGELGTGSKAIEPLPTPVQAPTGLKFTQVSAGQFYSLELSDDGNAYAWGLNSYGRLGDGTTNDSDTPVRVPAPAGARFVQVSASNVHSLALASDGTAYAWGSNGLGQLGDGTNDLTNAPTRVQQPAGVRLSRLGALDHHYLALGDDGHAYAWGSGALGTLGSGSHGSGASSNTPVPVRIESAVTSVDFGVTSGSDLVDNADGTVSVTAPPHASGPVDVEVRWTLNGKPRAPIAYASGFTYLSMPSLGDPSDQRVAAGATATFTVTITGEPAPR